MNPLKENLNSKQTQYLKGLAHHLTPTVFIGQNGLTQPVIRSLNEALDLHELIKIKFVAFKKKNQKIEILEQVIDTTNSTFINQVGHIAIIYRRHPDPEKVRIHLPEPASHLNNTELQ